MAVVISDTSPVRALAHLGHLTWLETLFGQISLPPAVAVELREPPPGLSAVDVHTYPFLNLQAPASQMRVSELLSVLDLGEAEAIALAEELHAEIVLIDERAGREIARDCGFTVLGTLGILMRAKEQGLCLEIRPLLDRLQHEAKFFVSASLRASILKQAGETDILAQ
jgi:predicted nucleic acid-binding protein